MEWVCPQYSRSRVDWAGELLISDRPDLAKFDEALTIINNWRASHSRPLYTFRLGLRRHAEKVDESALVAAGPTPSQLVANQELLQEFRKRLSDDERRLADQRAQGLSWADIAAEWGSNADTLRMQLTRAIDRVTQELRLEE